MSRGRKGIPLFIMRSEPIQRIEGQITRLKKEIEGKQGEIRSLTRQLEKILTLNETCPACRGSGLERYTDAAGSSDTRDCEVCQGLGVIGPITCQCGHVIGTDMIAVRNQTYPRCPWCGNTLRVY